MFNLLLAFLLSVHHKQELTFITTPRCPLFANTLFYNKPPTHTHNIGEPIKQNIILLSRTLPKLKIEKLHELYINTHTHQTHCVR